MLFQQIPHVSPTGQYTTGIPLLMILCVSAVKEIFEDIVSVLILFFLLDLIIIILSVIYTLLMESFT
jgi:hypothetical protein